MDRSNHYRAFLNIIAVLLLPGLALAQQNSDAVSAQYTDTNYLLVRINKPTTLFTVVQAVCKQLKAECEVDSLQKADVTVAPISLNGTWEDVMGKLFEGTQFNFAAMHRLGQNDAAKLLIQEKPVGSDLGQRDTSNVVASGNSSYAMNPDATPTSNPDTTSSSNSADSNNQASALDNIVPGITMSAGQSGMSSEGMQPQFNGAVATPLPGIPTEYHGPVGPPLPGIPTDYHGPSGGPLPGIVITHDDSSSRPQPGVPFKIF